MESMHAIPSQTAAGLVFAALTLAAAPALHTRPDPAAVNVRLSEWKVELSQRPIAAGSVTFAVTNTGRPAYHCDQAGWLVASPIQFCTSVFQWAAP